MLHTICLDLRARSGQRSGKSREDRLRQVANRLHPGAPVLSPRQPIPDTDADGVAVIRSLKFGLNAVVLGADRAPSCRGHYWTVCT